MARSKSPSGNKSTRTPKPEEAGINVPASVSDAKPVVSAPAPDEITTRVEVKPEIKAEPRKLEVMKNDRKNLVPINLDDEIRRRAYELYQQRGAGTGSETEDWFSAEREIRQRYRQQIA